MNVVEGLECTERTKHLLCMVWDTKLPRLLLMT